MAQELADGEFWLPPEFLNDEDILMDVVPGKPNSSNLKAGYNRSSSGVYGYGPNSDLNSPVESVFGSTETESDEEDYLNGLTRKFANSTLQDDFWKPNFENNHSSKCTRVIAGSPQSTLCDCKQGSSRGSPNCLSPPATVALVNRNEPSSELLYAAADEVVRMRMVEEAAKRYYKTQQTHSRRPANHNLHYQQLQVAQQLEQLQMLKQRHYLQMIEQSRTRNETGNVRVGSAWPRPQQPQQQPTQRTPGSGMRAVFLGNPSTKRESIGTGVFLPRQIGALTEPIKKRGCSTVLLPDRVLQALNLNLEAMETESKLQSRCNGLSDAEMMYRNGVMMSQQKRNNHRQPPSTMSEFRLPQEWTY